MSEINIVLGTSSKYRHQLFRQHFPKLPFTARAPDIDERAVSVGQGERAVSDPCALTLAVAHAKADALVPLLAVGTVLLTSDQVVVCRGQIREKPDSEAECRKFLMDYCEHPVTTVCAVVITVVGKDGRRADGTDVATQHFHPFPATVVDKLIEKGDVMYCAGGVTVEDELLGPYHAKREGTLESITGLPVHLVHSLLQQVGVPVDRP